MEFLQPAWLWGMGGAIMPIIIHFWYQKKGKTIAWAASRWLAEKTTVQHRGPRLHDLLLLLVRCLIVALIALLMARLIVNSRKAGNRTVHLVEPVEMLADNFRFEIEKALKNGETVLWIGKEGLKMERITDVKADPDAVLHLQEMVNSLSGKYDFFNFYINSKTELADIPKIYVPGVFRLWSVPDSSQRPSIPFLQFGGKKVFADPRSRQLVTTSEPIRDLASAPVHRGPLRARIDFRNEAENQAVKAALAALTDVYGIEFTFNGIRKEAERYDLITTDKLPLNADPAVLYLVSGYPVSQFQRANVLQLPDPLQISESHIVRDGRLPEMIGQALFAHYKLVPDAKWLSNAQLKANFKQIKSIPEEEADRSRKMLLLLLMLLFAVERGLALPKKWVKSDAYA